MSRNLKIELIVTLVLITATVGLVLLVMNLLHLPMYVHRTIAQDVNINTEWTELTPSSPMKIKRQFQSVSLVINGAKTKTKSLGLFLSDGVQIQPKLQISDMKGNWYDLEGGSYGVSDYDSATETFNADFADFHLPELPSNTEFKTIRIRSDHPFTCAKIIWTNYDMK